jgi:hypothetical protein
MGLPVDEVLADYRIAGRQRARVGHLPEQLGQVAEHVTDGPAGAGAGGGPLVGRQGDGQGGKGFVVGAEGVDGGGGHEDSSAVAARSHTISM